MFEKVSTDAGFVRGEHDVLRFWRDSQIFAKLRKQNAGRPRWSFLDGPITANNPMGVHHAWGRTYKDAYQRYFAMTGRELRYQNGFDCQGLWVEVEVEKELSLGTKNSVADFGIDQFTHACKKRVLTFAARQTEQSIRLGYWMDWDDPATLRQLAAHVGQATPQTIRTPSGRQVSGSAEELVAGLGHQYVSLHGDPRRAYPYFTGHADETGTGKGLGSTFNVPLPKRTADDAYISALSTCAEKIAAFKPTALIVSLGLDT
ncbi:MAG: class I tRNA ligase family protein, partial [Planctomycetaceae bacterium]